jgi:hypothetical protein
MPRALPKGGLSLRMAALLLFWGPPLSALEKPPLLEAELDLFQPICSSTDLDEVRAAVQSASDLLQSRCQLRLKLRTARTLPLDSEWCHWPDVPAERQQRFQALAREAKAAHPRRLGLFLLPSGADQRLSWALVDESLRSGCDSPQEARFLPRFGSFFFTDLTWMLAKPAPGETGPSKAALLVAHEALHALTQRTHPSGATRGSVMADRLVDMGPAIADDWCACARRSPYARKP